MGNVELIAHLNQMSSRFKYVCKLGLTLNVYKQSSVSVPQILEHIVRVRWHL
jgi:hypothetical protein